MVSRRAAFAILTVVMVTCAAASTAGPTFAAGKRVVAQGRILSPSGDGMAGWPVLLVATQRYIELKRFTSGGDMVTAAHVTTDASGYFSIDVPKDRHFQFWFLRFTEAGRLDTVKYLPPDDVEITADVRRGRVASIEKTIRMHPDWPEVERRVAEAGGESTERGRILRTLGLPEKSVRDDPSGVEEWWYFTKGIVYTFRGTQSLGERHFEPVKPPKDSGSAPTSAGGTTGREGH